MSMDLITASKIVKNSIEKTYFRCREIESNAVQGDPILIGNIRFLKRMNDFLEELIIDEEKINGKRRSI